MAERLTWTRGVESQGTSETPTSSKSSGPADKSSGRFFFEKKQNFKQFC